MISGRYDWIRYWVERGSHVSLADGGFPADPTSGAGAYYNQALSRFDDITQYPVLVLLGEPGIGKSDEVEVAVKKCQRQVQEAGGVDVVLKFDLREYGTETDLKNIFTSDTFRAWVEGTHKLHLFLDSLDECRLRIKDVAQTLVRMLRPCPIERLYLRISCRTAEWPIYLESELTRLCEQNDTLRQTWGSPQGNGAHGNRAASRPSHRMVSRSSNATSSSEGSRTGAMRIYELVPLTRRDVLSAAEMLGLEPAAFIAEVERRDVVPLAIKPLTLKFLLESYGDKREFGATRADLYVEGCYRLCEETNPSRRASDLIGNLLPEQRLAVAARIAAITIFCNRFAVWTGTSADTNANERDNVAVRELYNGFERTTGGSFAVTHSDIKETLNTGLFSSRGQQRIGWVHQTYAEYLAAWYLLQHDMDREQIMSLLVQPNDPDGRLVPQLYEVAAWLSTMDADIFRAVLDVDPVVLLRSDVKAMTNEIIGQVVAALLAQFEEGKLLDLPGTLRTLISRLDYPGLPAQLRPYIIDKSRGERVRDVAVDIAEACALQDLDSELAAVALDPTAPMHLRINAAAAVMRIGSDTAKADLKPLISDARHKDIDDELRGAALLAMWPQHITAQELFAALTPPKIRNLISLYTRLFYDDVMQHLRPDDMDVAFDWVERLPAGVGRDPMYQAVTDSILYKAWEYMEVPGVIERLATLLLQRKRYTYDLFHHAGSEAPIVVAIIEDDARRRRLLRYLVHTFAMSGEPPNHIVWAGLVLSRDIPWLIEQIKEGSATGRDIQGQQVKSDHTAPDNGRDDADDADDADTQVVDKEQLVLVQLCQSALAVDDGPSLEAIYAARDNKVVAEHFRWLLEGIELNSEQATQWKEFHRRHQQPHDEEPEEDVDQPTEPLSVRIGRLLDRFDGGETDAWWQLNIALLPKPGSNQYRDRDEFESDLTRFPGWSALEEETRVRIVETAPLYLHRQEQRPEKWLREGEIYHWRPAYAAFRALRLLLRHAPRLLDTLSIETWQKWAPLIVRYQVLTDEDTASEGAATSDQRALVGLAYERAAQAILDAAPVLIDRDSKETRSPRIVEHLEDYWDDGIAGTLTKKLLDTRLNPYTWGELLCALLKHRVSKAGEFAESLLTQEPLPARGKRRALAVVAADKLASCAEADQWETVWAAVQRNERFGREAFERLVHNDRHAMGQSPVSQRLSETQLADLYIWLAKHYPHSEDEKHEGSELRMHPVTTRDEMQRWRDSIPGILVERGTIGAVNEIRRIMRELPHVSYLEYSLHRAKDAMRRLTWEPLRPETLLESVRDNSARGEIGEITDADIDDVIDNWGRPSYQSRHLEVSHVRRWLAQFPAGRPQRLMFKLLEHLQFYNEVKVREKLKVIHNHVTAELGRQENQSKVNSHILVIAPGNVAKSAPSYSRMYMSANGLTHHNIVALNDAAAKLATTPGIKAIVLIDDIIGTGGTFVEALKTLSSECGPQLHENHIRVFAAAVCGLSEGLDAVQAASEELDLPVDVFVPDVLLAKDKCFSSKSRIFEVVEDRDEARRVATEYGSSLQKQQPLGYEGGQLLVVFTDNCPNNTLPILWSPGRKDEWYPLFRRTGF